MRLGIVARCETARGISIQTKGFYDHMPVDSVLLVRFPKPDCAEAPEWYPGATTVMYDPRHHELDERTVRAWLSGVDVVFTVETPYDWRMCDWCKEAGVKLVVQGNPEFVRHGQQGWDLPHPDEWWWPTTWRLEHLPAGIVMPVPMPDRMLFDRDVDETLRVVHVVGKRAHMDRNGTDLLVQALRRVRRKMHVTIYGIDGELPKVPVGVASQHIKVTYHPNGVEDRWEMYRNQDVLVLPRRYGGLCLPASEAAACGLAVMMPDCSPNASMAALLTPVRRYRPTVMAGGTIQMAEVAPVDLAQQLDALTFDGTLPTVKARQLALVPRWSQWAPRYLAELAR